MSQVIIGIDFGTTNSCAAVFINNELKMVPESDGKQFIPSMVSFNDNQILVGEDVRYQMMTNFENSIYQIKRILGRKYSDKSVILDKYKWPFRVLNDGNNQCRIKVRLNKQDKLVLPEEICAQIIKRLKQNGEKFIGKTIQDAVISVPASFNSNQKAAVRNAGLISGLNVKKLISEPNAAILAYGMDRDENDATTKVVLVYHLGGGTFNVSILRICGREFKVVSINGDNHLGGEDFTNQLVYQLFTEIKLAYKLSDEMPHQLRQRLRESCEEVKLKLSEDGCQTIDIELDHLFINNTDKEEINYKKTFSREAFEAINQKLFNKTIELVEQCLVEAELKINEIDEVLVIGGSTRIPKIRQILEDKFTKEKLNYSIDLEKIVAQGAAIEAALIGGSESSAVKNMKLIDVTSVTIGIESGKNDLMHHFIPRNSQFPFKASQVMMTFKDNQPKIHFPIYEGENKFTKDNNYLGKIELNNIPQGPAGSVQFNVTFELGENFDLNVMAIEPITKTSGNLTITRNFSCLSEKQIENFIEYYEEQEKLGLIDHKNAELKRQLEKYTYDAFRHMSLKSSPEKIAPDNLEDCRSKLHLAREFLSDSENVSEMEMETTLTELKLVCDSVLNELLNEDQGDNIEE